MCNYYTRPPLPLNEVLNSSGSQVTRLLVIRGGGDRIIIIMPRAEEVEQIGSGIRGQLNQASSLLIFAASAAAGLRGRHTGGPRDCCGPDPTVSWSATAAAGL